VADTQIMLLSNYAPPRLQRALFAEPCYIAASDNARVCRPDTFTAGPLSPERSLPSLSSSEVRDTTALYDLCASGQAFDLYAESVEYFDASNIVVGVRRATLADLGRLLMGAPVGGRTVFLFAHTGDVGLVREGRPFPSTAFSIAMAGSSGEGFVNATTQALLFATCPALRTLPDVGGLVGHSLASSAHALRMVTNLAVNPFALFELLDARAAEACPENALAHSALDDCGMRLIALDDAFVEAYKASASLWGVALWFVRAVIPPGAGDTDAQGRPTTLALLQAFLQGAVVTGEATHVLTMLDAPRLLASFDTGMQKLLEGDAGGGRRRRLLQSGGGGSSIMGSVSGGVKGGFRGFMKLTSLIGSVASGSVFAGADLGGMLATQSPPGRMAGAMVAAPAIAWAHFTYGVLAPMAIDTIALVRAGRPSVAPLFLHLHEAMDAFETLVDARQRQVHAFTLTATYRLALEARAHRQQRRSGSSSSSSAVVAAAVVVEGCCCCDDSRRHGRL
jgi:hypothetical protein